MSNQTQQQGGAPGTGVAGPLVLIGASALLVVVAVLEPWSSSSAPPVSPMGAAAPRGGGMSGGGVGPVRRPSGAPAGGGRSPNASPSIAWAAPEGWVEEPPANQMRVAQYRLPAADGDAEDATMVVARFGGDGGGIQANIDRWIGQWQAADGSPLPRGDVNITTRAVGSLTLTSLVLSGRFVAAVQPGAAEKHDKASHAMFAMLIITPEGLYSFKGVGPAATMARWQESLEEFRASIIER